MGILAEVPSPPAVWRSCGSGTLLSLPDTARCRADHHHDRCMNAMDRPERKRYRPRDAGEPPLGGG